MIKKYICFLIFTFLSSCHQKKNKNITNSNEIDLKKSDLFSKVFYISTQLNEVDCKAYNDGCDCCDGKIVFLKNGTFISNYYCLPSETYNYGTFNIEQGKLILNYYKTEAIYGPEDGNDYDAESVLKLESFESGTSRLEIKKCNDFYYFKNENDYFTIDTIPFLEAIKEYKKIGVWKLFDLKE